MTRHPGRASRSIQIPENHPEMSVMKAKTRKFRDFLKNEQNPEEIVGFVNFEAQNTKLTFEN